MNSMQMDITKITKIRLQGIASSFFRYAEHLMGHLSLTTSSCSRPVTVPRPRDRLLPEQSNSRCSGNPRVAFSAYLTTSPDFVKQKKYYCRDRDCVFDVQLAIPIPFLQKT
jgi:hypothetical protein